MCTFESKIPFVFSSPILKEMMGMEDLDKSFMNSKHLLTRIEKFVEF